MLKNVDWNRVGGWRIARAAEDGPPVASMTSVLPLRRRATTAPASDSSAPPHGRGTLIFPPARLQATTVSPQRTA